MKVETYLPVFPGFYQTIFEADEEMEIYNINESRQELGLEEINFDDCEFNYDEYHQGVSKVCCEAIEKVLNSIFRNIVEVEFQELISPKFYNYSTDAINVEIDLDIDYVIEYLRDNLDEFKTYLKDHYTSCDGFIPNHSTDVEEWIKTLKSGKELQHKLGSTLHFILENEDYDQEDLYNDLDYFDKPYIYATNFDELTTKN